MPPAARALTSLGGGGVHFREETLCKLRKHIKKDKKTDEQISCEIIMKTQRFRESL